jgi:hypothetical protein
MDYGEQALRGPAPGLDLSTLTAWLPQASTAITDMDYLGRVWRLMFARLRNRAGWRPNDLADIHFLAAAAGYADVVAGEKRTISDLSSARNIVAGAKLGKSLSDAAAAAQEVLTEGPKTTTSENPRVA